MKHHPDRVDSVYQSSIAWLYRGTRNLKNKIEKFGRPALVVRYEDLVEQTVSTLHRIGNFVGIPFNGEEMKYWLAEHHLLAGNSGTIETLIRLQDGEEKTGSGEDDYYDRLVRQLVNSGGRPILDDSWKQRYSEEELAAYEYSNGTVYGAFGYPASEYSEQARRNFYQSFTPPESVEEAAKSVGPWRRDSARNEEQPTPLLRRVFASIRYRISKIG